MRAYHSSVGHAIIGPTEISEFNERDETGKPCSFPFGVTASAYYRRTQSRLLFKATEENQDVDYEALSGKKNSILFTVGYQHDQVEVSGYYFYSYWTREQNMESFDSRPVTYMSEARSFGFNVDYTMRYHNR